MMASAAGDTAPIGVGIIGLSATRGWAATAHLPALRSQPGYEVVALSASSPESARAAAEQHGVPTAAADHQTLVADPGVDLVVVTVKVPEHRRLVSAALRAGKDVLCEWPLGNGLAEAEELAALADRQGVRGFVGLQARAAPPVRFVRDLVASGAIGDVLSTTIVGDGDRWGPTVDATTQYLADRANGATMLTIPLAHTLDGVCFCLGELTEVSATTAVRRPLVTRTDTGEQVPMTAEDQLAISGRLEGGAVISVHYRGGRSPGLGLTWEINGSAGTILVTGPSGHLQYGQVEVQVARDGARELTPCPIPAGYEAVAADPAGLPYTVAQAYAHLRQDLRDGSALMPTFADAVRRHRSLAAIERAAATGERQLIPIEPQDTAS